MGGKLRYLARTGDAFTIRLATVADAPALARHRAEMFRDMGDLPDELYDPLVDASRRALDACLRTGEYVGWVVCPADHPDEIVAGAGIQLRRLLPRPEASRREVRRGPEAIVVNVFTERAWRRRGTARRPMERVSPWAQGQGGPPPGLHASAWGRPRC